MLPEFRRQRQGGSVQFLEVFDDGRGARQLANLPEAEIEDGLFDIVHLGGEVEKHGVDHAQQARRERRGSRRMTSAICEFRLRSDCNKSPNARLNAGERGEFWAGIDAPGDFGFRTNRRDTGGGNIRDHRWHDIF